MDQQPTSSLNTSGGDLGWNLTQLVFDHRQLLQLSKRKEEESYFVDYTPPARDAITLPRNVVYVLVGVVLVIVATYAIVGHLIKDLMHDLAGHFQDHVYFPPQYPYAIKVYSHHPCKVLIVGRQSIYQQNWILGPKPVEDDFEEGRAEIEAERQACIPSELVEKDRLKMEQGRDRLLPGLHQGPGSCHLSTPLLRSAISSCPGEKKISTHSVTFACPMTPYVTSL